MTSNITSPENAQAQALSRADDQASLLPRVVLGPRALNDYELLTTGAFMPLASFMGSADYLSCLATMRLAGGQLFPLPITLPIPEPFEMGARLP